MTTAITQIKPLCTIHCSNDEVIFVEMTVAQLDEKMQNSYMILDDGRRFSTARNLIRSYWPASAIENYEYFIVPSLPEHVKSQMQDLLWRLSPEAKKKATLDALIKKQETFN